MNNIIADPYQGRATKSLRILLVSGYFPPFAPIGAVRPGKLAEYWKELGHDVRVIAIALSPEASACANSDIYYLGYSEPGRSITKAKRQIEQSPVRLFMPLPWLRRQFERSAATKAANPSHARAGSLAEFYRQAIRFPDRYRSWIRPALQLAVSWQPDWQPDLVYSSGPPNSGHMLASTLSRRLARPWIAELRDLWIGNPYVDQHRVIRPAQDWVARNTLSRASAFVAVTRSAQQQIAATTGKPVILSYNGYDPKDFEGLVDAQSYDSERLTILHAGVIYPGRRDPSSLFKAISALGSEAQKIRCLFYGDSTGSIPALAQKWGVQSSVEVYRELPRSQVLALERQVDVLLECHWQDSAGDGVIPGKLFEYIGARRPILSIGSVTAEAAAIVHENGFGRCSNDPDEIRAILSEWLAQKSRMSRLPDSAAPIDDRFQRASQFRKVDELIQCVTEHVHPAK